MSYSITFLESADGVPITKKYGPKGKSSYPHVLNFTSHTKTIETSSELRDVMRAHAAKHHCMLKGALKRPLEHESRAGSTNSHEPTNWICLDVDGLPGIKSAEDLVSQIKPLKNASYVQQASCSMGVEPDKGLSIHLFWLLDEEVSPPLLKEWLTTLNLTVPLLRENIRLNRARTVLKWPLDITVCQNDKLIYIAPPILQEPWEDTLEGERIDLIKKKNSYASLNLDGINPSWNQAEALRIFNDLRTAEGLKPRRKDSTKTVNQVPVLSNAGTAQVTGVKAERGFVYLNLNGGDSWGYYHPEDRPEVIFNFKGEPNYETKSFLPDYYTEAVTKAKSAPSSMLPSGGRYYLAFLDSKSDQYYRGTYDTATGQLDLSSTNSHKKLVDFLKQHGQPVGDYVPEWDISYNFESDEVINFEKRTINLYQRSPYLINSVSSSEMPENTAKLLWHVLGGNKETYDHFINWLAVIIQTRKKTGTAWVLHGTQGTGKGVLFSQVIAPLLGGHYCSRAQLPNFEAEFNGFMERSLLVFVDEVQISTLQKRSIAMARLKQFITDPSVTIRRMYANQYDVENHSNFILASNKHDSVEVDPDDRRFNIAIRQNTPLLKVMTPQEIKAIEGELPQVAGFLLNASADRNQAATVLFNEERTRLQELTRDSNESIADKIRAGDIGFFVDNRPDNLYDNTGLELATDRSGLPAYAEVIDEMFASEGEVTQIPRSHLEVLYYHISRQYFKTPHKFSKFIGHKGLNVRQIRHHILGKTQGVSGIKWQMNHLLKKEWEEIKRLSQPAQKPQLQAVNDKKT